MRVLFFLLLLANLGLLGWQAWHDSSNGRSWPNGRGDVAPERRLVLVGEQEASPSGGPDLQVPTAGVVVEQPAEGDSPAETGQAPPRCSTLGPFEQLEMAEVAHARLVDAGNRAVLRESGGQIRSGFWVYLPPFEDRDAAEEVEDELRARQVQDLFIVTGAEQQNAISLGLFSTPERADQRAAEIGRLGYTPRIAERFRDATVYWLDFVEQPGAPLEPESLGVMASGETLPEKRAISCDDIAAAAGGA